MGMMRMNCCRNCGSNLVGMWSDDKKRYAQCDTCQAQGPAHASATQAMKLWDEKNPPHNPSHGAREVVGILRTSLAGLFIGNRRKS